jgi:hypothetical protein
MVWEAGFGHQGRKRRGWHTHTLRVLVAGEGPDEDLRTPGIGLAVAARAQPRRTPGTGLAVAARTQPRKGSPVPSPPARDGARGRAACVPAGVPRAPSGDAPMGEGRAARELGEEERWPCSVRRRTRVV